VEQAVALIEIGKIASQLGEHSRCTEAFKQALPLVAKYEGEKSDSYVEIVRLLSISLMREQKG